MSLFCSERIANGFACTVGIAGPDFDLVGTAVHLLVVYAVDDFAVDSGDAVAAIDGFTSAVHFASTPFPYSGAWRAGCGGFGGRIVSRRSATLSMDTESPLISEKICYF